MYNSHNSRNLTEMSFLTITFLLLSFVFLVHSTTQYSFVIDYDNNQFLKDGQPYRYISGSMHYFRVPNEYWVDRLTKLKAGGLNAVEFYIPWNVHEPEEGKFYFEGDADLLRFVKLCKTIGLDVIMRMGPYTCGEFENGGLPWWLLKIKPDIRMRRADERFLYHASRWYFKLMPMLVPYLYKNGGPIIMMQVENEYGSRSYCDRNYTTFLRDLFRSYVGEEFVLFTVDGGGLGYLKCGFIPGVYPTVDFGTGSREGVASAFSAQRTYAPKGPLVNTEFYPGWLDLWGRNHSTSATGPILSTMEYMYDMGASFNFYMYEGKVITNDTHIKNIV